jgi:hypothetical protein
VPLLDRLPVKAAEGQLVAEEPGGEKVEDRPQLAQVVLDRRAGEAEAVRGIDLLERAAGLGPGVLDGLRLVEDEQVEAVASCSSSMATSGYVVMTTSAVGMKAKRPRRAAPWRTSTRRWGANLASSRAQFPTRLVGATMSAGARSSPRSFSRHRWAMVWSVFPRPMSSARTPPVSHARRCCRKATPSSW